jgi:hypothetical protein
MIFKFYIKILNLKKMNNNNKTQSHHDKMKKNIYSNKNEGYTGFISASYTNQTQIIDKNVPQLKYCENININKANNYPIVSSLSSNDGCIINDKNNIIYYNNNFTDLSKEKANEIQTNLIIQKKTYTNEEKTKTRGIIIHSDSNFKTPKEYKGISGCNSCGGSGYKFSKTNSKSNPCEKCMIAQNYCAYCNNTGEVHENNYSKPCRCRGENCNIF